jgi:multidrug efflux pump subunit AcrA (membrane-fusion protein)
MQPDLDTNSYAAAVTMVKPHNINVLSGMSGLVHIQSEAKERAFSLPASAWISQQESSGKVWRFDPMTEQINQIQLSTNENGAVTAGLQQGDQIVVAGAANLVEGQRVKLWTREGGI